MDDGQPGHVGAQRQALGRSVADLVEAARSQGLSQTDLALLAGTRQSNISMLASGRRGVPGSPVREALIELGNVLDRAPADPEVAAQLRARAARARHSPGRAVPGRRPVVPQQARRVEPVPPVVQSLPAAPTPGPVDAGRAALEAEVQRLRRQLAALTAAHRALLDAVVTG